MTPWPLSFELHTEFAMWRQVLEQTRTYYLYGHINQLDFNRRLSALGFRDHEIAAEHDYIMAQNLEKEIQP